MVAVKQFELLGLFAARMDVFSTYGGLSKREIAEIDARGDYYRRLQQQVALAPETADELDHEWQALQNVPHSPTPPADSHSQEFPHRIREA